MLMDLQYVPAVLTPAGKDNAVAMVKEISELAREAGINVFRRFAFMESLYAIEQVSFDRMVDPTDNDRLHCSDWATDRVAWAPKLAIAGGVDGHRQPQATASACCPYSAALDRRGVEGLNGKAPLRMARSLGQAFERGSAEQTLGGDVAVFHFGQEFRLDPRGLRVPDWFGKFRCRVHNCVKLLADLSRHGP